MHRRDNGMDALLSCRILAGAVLVILVVTLVIKERENQKISMFIPSVLLALLSLVFSVYAGMVPAEEADSIRAAVQAFMEVMVPLTEGFSLALFCLFLKTELFHGDKRKGRLLSAFSFLCVPFTIFAAFLPIRAAAFPAVFLFQTSLAVLFIALSDTAKNVRIWFIAACMLYLLTCVICIVSPALQWDGIGMMLMDLTVFIGYEVQLKNDMLRRELELSEAKTALLMRQISPHFIFNSLHVIIGLCDKDPDHVKPALEHFSEYLRGNLESITRNELIPFERELAHIREYIALEQYGEGRSFEVEYDLGITDFLLPPLAVQPIVENAIRYGIGTRTSGGHIVIQTTDTPFMTLIRVRDDGSGKSSITDQQKKRQSVGLSNVRQRLKTLCGGEVKLEQSDAGTTVTISLPKPMK